MTNMTPQRISFLGLTLDTGISIADICNLLGKKDAAYLLTFVNGASWALAAKQPEYISLLEQMSLVIPASLDVACAAKKLTGNTSSDICFETHSLATPFFKTAIDNKNSLMIVGGQPAIDERVHDKLNTQYPGIDIITSANGYGDIAPKIALVIEKNPDAVLVDYPCPKAEAFLIALKNVGYKGLAIACTGFFEETLRDDEFYPSWAKRWNIQFAYRLLAEPKTALPSFIGSYPAFAVTVCKAFADKYLPKKN
jgi:exopolysaccharide biosynthesis WecB/TagA/CpsF family protein